MADINFVNQAQPFTFNFNDASLMLNNQGITGTNTNTTINVSNVDTNDFGPSRSYIPTPLQAAP